MEGQNVTVSAVLGQHLISEGFPTEWVFNPVLTGDLVATTSMKRGGRDREREIKS